MTLQDFVLKLVLSEVPKWEEDHRRKLLLQALRKRHAWRKSDISRLRAIGVPRYAETRLDRLAASNKLGAPTVLKPKTFEQIAKGKIREMRVWLHPDTPRHQRANFYRATRWFPELLEAAYRGELSALKEAGKRLSKEQREAPHTPPSIQAERNVAEAAGVSAAIVRKCCHDERKARGRRPPDLPPTSALELKHYLENGSVSRSPDEAEALRRFFQHLK